MAERDLHFAAATTDLIFHPPWTARLSRADREMRQHPQTVRDLLAYPNRGDYDGEYKNLIKFSSERLRSRWRNNWQEVLIVGPLVNRNRPLDAITYVLHGDIRSLDANLDAMSNTLASTYMEFGILPSIFLFNERYVAGLKADKNRNWSLTDKFSVHIER